MHTTALLNKLWEFTRGVKEDKDGFIQKETCVKDL